MILTFLILGAMVAGYSLRIAKLDGRYATAYAHLEEKYNLLARDHAHKSQWLKSLEQDLIKQIDQDLIIKKAYTPRRTRAFQEV